MIKRYEVFGNRIVDEVPKIRRIVARKKHPYSIKLHMIGYRIPAKYLKKLSANLYTRRTSRCDNNGEFNRQL